MGALDRVFRGRRLGQERPLAAIIAGLWRNGEQGVWYDVEGFRGAWNSVGPNITPSTAQVFGEASVVSPGVYRIYSSAGAFSSVSAVTTGSAVIGRKYIISFNVNSITTLGSGLAIESVENPTVTTIGPKSFLVTAVNTSLHIKHNSACDIQISGLSAKEWTGQGLCALYQDAAGTLPVYMPGQGQVDPPVGLLLDKRLGLVSGPELLTNGSFDAGATGWTVVGQDATHIVTFSGGQMRYQSDTTTPALSVLQSGVLTIGKWYVVEVDVAARVSGSMYLTGVTGAGLSTSVFFSPGVTRLILLASATTLGVARNNANVDITLNSISLRELSGNHAYQATTTSRPTLSARYNLLTSSENLASTWSVFNGSFSAVGGYWKFTENASANLHSFLQPLSQPKAASYRVSFVGKPAGRSVVRSVLNAYSGNFAEVRFNLATGAVVGVFTGGDGVVESYSIVQVEDGAYRCTIVGKPSAAAAGTAFDVSLGMMDGTSSSYTGDGVSGILVNYFDCRSTNDGAGLPPYQRVVDANTYDTAGFPLYLRFDGVDDWLQTGNVDFSGTDVVTMTTAYRKLSDAAVGEIFALSGNPTASSGTFGFYTPESANGTVAAVFFARGASSTISGQRLGAAPISCVAGGWVSISMPYMRYRINQGSSLTSSSATGGGNFGNYPLYIGRRSGTSFPFNGRLYSLILCGAATPDATIAKAERYLNSKARIY